MPIVRHPFFTICLILFPFDGGNKRWYLLQVILLCQEFDECRTDDGTIGVLRRFTKGVVVMNPEADDDWVI